VDDISIFSDQCQLHLPHLENFLNAIKRAGLALNLDKCCFAQKEVKFVGHIIGSGQRRTEPDKIVAVTEMKSPETKKQVRQIIGFFSYFRNYIPDFAAIEKPLSDLTGKHVYS